MGNTLKQQHRSAKSILAFRKAERKKDAKALAELIYDVYKEKKQREKSIIVSGQNNAKQPSNN